MVSRRIAYIDGLRAVAVLAVVAHHAIGYAGYAATSSVGRIFIYGARGVELFFVLSGFCLAYPTLLRFHATGAHGFDAIAYGARRIVRIVPPYWLAIAVLTALGIVFLRLGIPLPSAMHAGAFTVPQIIGQAFFMYADHQHIITDQFWTLPLEFSWYFAFPLLLLAWMRAQRSFLLILGALAFFIFSHALTAGTLLSYLPGFTLGIVAADMHIRGVRLGWFGVVACGLLVVLGSETSAGTWNQGVNIFWQLAAFAFVVCAGEIPHLRNALSLKWLVAIGVMSYSVYLMHAPIVALAEPFGPAVAGVLGVACGAAFWLVAERPFMKGQLRDALVSSLVEQARRIGARNNVSRRGTDGVDRDWVGEVDGSRLPGAGATAPTV